MKKFFIVLLALPVLAFVACTPSEIDTRILDNISEIRQTAFEGGNQFVTATVVTGERETPYDVDGKSHARKAFTSITIKPQDVAAVLEYSYKLVAGDKEFEGVFKMHPFGESYEVEIGEEISATSIVLTIIGNAQTHELTLESARTSDMIDWKGALAIALQSLEQEVNALFEEERFAGEGFVRFVGNLSDSDKGYYWYVAFRGENGQTIAVLIDPATSRVVSEKR